MNAAKMAISSSLNKLPANQLQPITSFDKLTDQISSIKQQKAELVYFFFKSVIYDIDNYHKIENTIRFKSVLDRYFNSLEFGDKYDFPKRLEMIQQSFGLPEKLASEDAILRKIFPFKQIKSELSKEISVTYRALRAVL